MAKRSPMTAAKRDREQAKREKRERKQAKKEAAGERNAPAESPVDGAALLTGETNS